MELVYSHESRCPCSSLWGGTVHSPLSWASLTCISLVRAETKGVLEALGGGRALRKGVTEGSPRSH